MLQTTDKLDEKQLKDLEDLQLRCKKKDISTPNLYTHILSQPRIFPAAVLYYKNMKLLGFLSAFFFYDKAVEVSLLVDPKARRQKIASKLIETILPLLQSQQLPTLIFSCPQKLNDNWLEKLGFSFMHSEYFMQRKILNPLLVSNHSLVFRPAENTDMPLLYSLDEACFGVKENADAHRFHNLIDNREYYVAIALVNNKPIGKAHMRWEAKGATLSDIAIEPSLQGKGLGSALIAHCVNYALSEGKSTISLDVETHNQKALNLYIRLGFSIQNACDYWKIGIDELSSKIALDKV